MAWRTVGGPAMARHDITLRSETQAIGLNDDLPAKTLAVPQRARVALSAILTQARALQPARAAVAGLALLVGTMLATSLFLLWSWPGASVATVIVASAYAGVHYIPPEWMLKLYRAEPLDVRHGLPFYQMTDALTHRAGLAAMPKLFVIPSLTVSAFSTGRPERAAIALTEGLLRRLSLAESGAVLAHEISHIRHGDLTAMARADALSRITQLMWIGSLVLLATRLPDYLAGQSRMPWLAIVLLLAAPAVSSFVQLMISRKREFDTDLDAVRLTGNQRRVATAIAKLEDYQGGLLEDFILPSRRIPLPSLLRAHPRTEARLARLERIEAMPQHPPLAVEEAPMVTMVGRGPGSLRPRYRLAGLWY